MKKREKFSWGDIRASKLERRRGNSCESIYLGGGGGAEFDTEKRF